MHRIFEGELNGLNSKWTKYKKKIWLQLRYLKNDYEPSFITELFDYFKSVDNDIVNDYHDFIKNILRYYTLAFSKANDFKNIKSIFLKRDDIDIVNFALKDLIMNMKKEGKLQKEGGKKASSTYKLNGDKVSLLINKKKLHRSVYVKGNGKAKYCKINNEFVLLSKLKNKIIE
jgi:hypothetical protein